MAESTKCDIDTCELGVVACARKMNTTCVFEGAADWIRREIIKLFLPLGISGIFVGPNEDLLYQ